MLFLARFILKGQSQAALVAATLATLGLILPPAAWLSAAAIVLVTLVHGAQRGLVTTALSLVGAALFAYLIFSRPHIAIMFVLIVWLPAWLLAVALRQTVSLAFSLQLLTAISLVAVATLYALFPDFGELWRESLDVMVNQLAEQSTEFDLTEFKQAEDWVIDFLPGLFASSIMFATMISLFVGRWWQAASYNEGGFAKEFQSLNLGRVSALCAIALVFFAMLFDSIVAVSLVTIVLVLYSVQALSILHAAIRIRKVNGVWLFFTYVVMFFIPHVFLLLIMTSFVDPWLNVRQRLSEMA